MYIAILTKSNAMSAAGFSVEGCDPVRLCGQALTSTWCRRTVVTV